MIVGTVEIVHLTPVQGDVMNYELMLFKMGVPARIDMDNCDNLGVFLSCLIAGGARKILADLGELQYIDSAGIGVFINIAKLLRGKRGEIAFCGVSADIRKLFKIVKLHGFIKIFNFEAEAVNYFRYFEPH